MSHKRTEAETALRKKKNLVLSKKWYAAQSDAKRMWMSAKARARQKGLEFNIDVDDIVVPSHCPVLGIPLYRGKGKLSYNSPTLDRRDNSKGYTKENIGVLSLKMNKMKSDMSTKQVERLYNYVFGLQNP